MSDTGIFGDAARLIEVERELFADIAHIIAKIINQEGPPFDVRQQVMNPPGNQSRDTMRPTTRGHIPHRQPRPEIATEASTAPLLAEARDLHFVKSVARRHAK
ncbi:hypothetical protein [Paracoccus lutimaris]|uniref:hypothetical protein n=1 Tax=Paracoccus lutimaris TaxID=1490030 RepID=UPI000DF26FB5|nr:hypothetical protein [Paracoccus lutimaris]